MLVFRPDKARTWYSSKHCGGILEIIEAMGSRMKKKKRGGEKGSGKKKVARGHGVTEKKRGASLPTLAEYKRMTPLRARQGLKKH